MKNTYTLFLVCIAISLQPIHTLFAQSLSSHPKTPIMGWSSWNNFRVGINENIVKAQADAMERSGLKEAGYRFINIDDGFTEGRDKNGELIVHHKRFPSGMKALAAYIHRKGFKAGIYSDAGINTCASMWDNDTLGAGSGLWGHDEQDLTLMLKTWGYDFIKIDWCGGLRLGLDEQVRYTQLASWIKSIKPEALLNICRWQFPGIWAVDIADSWRISGDITNKFESVMHIVDQNADLWKYSSPGHVNDMDMLQVGRGMSLEEDRTHFTMWCIMDSPLLLGNDLTTMSKATLQLVTNKEIIALNQDKLGYQARRIYKDRELEVWAKPLVSSMSGMIAVTLLNRSSKSEKITFDLDSLGIKPAKGYTMRDLWKHKDLSASNRNTQSFEVGSHEVLTLKITGEAKPFNVFQFGTPKKRN